MTFDGIMENTFYLLALLNPASKVLFLAAYEPELTAKQNFELTWKSSAAALIILILLAYAGNLILNRVFHVELYSLQITGGLVVFMIGWTAIKEGRFIQKKENELRSSFTDVSLVPLAAPLIAGPGAANRESPENSHFFLQTVAEFRPYFETIRDTVKDLPLGGIAFYRGNDLQNSLANDWVHTIEPQETPLWENAIPMGVPEAEPEVYALSERTVRELTAADLQYLSSRTTLIDVKSFRDLQNRFPETKFLQKVNCIIPAVGTAELFDGKSALNVTLAIQPVDNTVKPLSTLSTMPGTCGSCIIPTDRNGKMIVIQRFSDWTGYRRKAILDAVDSTLNGGLSIRLEPGGFAVAPMSRMTKDGRTAAAFLINTSIGKTPVLRLKIRRPAFRNWELIYFDKSPVNAKILVANEQEIELELPALSGWQPVMIKGKN